MRAAVLVERESEGEDEGEGGRRSRPALCFSVSRQQCKACSVTRAVRVRRCALVPIAR